MEVERGWKGDTPPRDEGLEDKRRQDDSVGETMEGVYLIGRARAASAVIPHVYGWRRRNESERADWIETRDDIEDELPVLRREHTVAEARLK